MKAISKTLLISLGIGILAFAGGCAQEGLPAGMSPEDVITKALLNQTEYTESVFELKADADLKGEVDGGDNSLNGNFILTGSSNTDSKEMSVIIDVDADMNDQTFKAKVELRSTADGVFIKINNIETSDPDTKEMVDLFVKDYVGQWVKLTFMTADDLTQSGFMEVNYKEGDPIPFKNIEYKGTTDILGLKSYHFTAEIDEQLILDLMQGTDTTNAQKFFDAADIKGDIYVAVDEMALTGFGANIKLDDPEMNGVINMSFKVNPTKSAKVETPKSEKEFTEEDMMGLMFGGAAMSDPSLMESVDSATTDDSTTDDSAAMKATTDSEQ